MSDILLGVEDGCFDIRLKDGDLERDEGLETAVAISLFTNRRVGDEELPDLATSKEGWWGDTFPEVDLDRIGSRLWTLDREKRVIETLRKAEDYAREALNWLLEDGVASSIEVEASFVGDAPAGQWQLDIVIVKPPGRQSRFQVLWEQQELRRI